MKYLLFFLSLLVATCYAQNFTNDTSSGSGMGCTDDMCTGVGALCVEGMSGPYCTCSPGRRLVSLSHCEVCPIGTWGHNCNMTCANNCGGKGRVSSCDAVNGTCQCNSCWMKASGSRVCGNATLANAGFQCFIDFVELTEKTLDSYGGEIPQPDPTKWRALAANLLKSADTVVQESSAELTIIDRSDVGARPLARFSFTVLNQGSTDYNSAINSIKTDIKDGDYRATLIIDESDGSTGKVTVNV